VQQWAVYFTQYQLLPYQRTAQIFEDLFGQPLSASFLVGNHHRCASILEPFMQDLKAQLLSEPVVHADETGFYFEGKRNWLHTLSTEQHSFYAVHGKRGTAALNDIAILPAYRGGA
jgi:transposase